MYNYCISVVSGAYEHREGASNSIIFCKPSVVESHLCKLQTTVNCISDLSRRDKCLLKN